MKLVLRSVVRSFLAVVSVLLCVAASAFVSGCAARGPINPSFPLSLDEAKAAIDSMKDQPREFERPVIVVGGLMDPGLGTWWVHSDLEEMTTRPEQVIRVGFFTACSIEECRERVIAAVDEAFPSTDPVWTSEVDVIAMSMGGVVARLAAAAPDPGADPSRRLRIARLFTLSTPHRGANLAGIPPVHPLALELRYGSDTLLRIDRAYRARDYEVLPYVRLDDFIVGAENAAPHGESPWWVSNGTFNFAHLVGCVDPRPNADIARRLRGEPTFATRPAAPLPSAAAPDFVRTNGRSLR